MNGTAENGEFGRSISASQDLLAVGKPAGANGQQVQLYEYHPPSNQYSRQSTITSVDTSNNSLLFGWSVSLFDTTLAVGDPEDDIVGQADSGTIDIIELELGVGFDDWVRSARISASDADQDDGLGFSVALDGEILIGGAPGNDDDGADSGAAYVFARNEGGAEAWGEVAKLTAADGAAGDSFGHSVAVSVDTAVVGAPGADGGNGAVYVFNRNQGGRDAWGQVAKISVAAAQAIGLGESVAVEFDRLVAGMPGGSSGGAAYVFERNEGGADAWGQVAELLAADSVVGDAFGQAVTLREDTVVVGAVFDDAQGNAYVFRRNEGGADAWGQAAKLDLEIGMDALQGAAVALSDELIFVGRPRTDFRTSLGIEEDAGSVAIFSISGRSWQRQARPRPVDPAADQEFGAAVAVSGDLAVVGAPGDSETAAAAGAAYVFERNHGGAERWRQVAKLLAGDGAAGDHFGFAVAIAGDTVLVGAPGADTAGADSGSAYVFARNQGGADAWGELVQISTFEDEAGDQLGFAVSLAGETAAVGAPGDNLGTGAAYIFERNRGGLDAWREVIKLSDAAGNPGDSFGASVAVAQGRTLVGAPFAGLSSRGQVYYFERNFGGLEAWGLRDFRGTVALGGEHGTSVDLDTRFGIVGEPGLDNLLEDSGAIHSATATSDGMFSLAGGGVSFFALGDRYGSAVARTWRRVTGGAPGADRAGIDSGVVVVDGQELNRQEILLGETAAGDAFGSALAMSGRTMVVGAPGNDDDGDSGGAVYILRLDDAPEIDLRLSKTESVDPVVAGSGNGNLSYTLDVTNFGGIVDASGIEIELALDLPPGVTVDAITPSVGTFDGAVWILGDLLLSATETLTVELTVGGQADLGTDVIGCAARVLYAEQVLISTGDDRVVERTSIDGEVDLELVVAESIDPVVAGSGSGNLSYVATLTNYGPDPATGVEVGAVFTLPPGVIVDSVTPTQGSFAGGTWSVGGLAVGASTTLTAVLSVDADAAIATDAIGLTATVTAAGEFLYNTDDDNESEATSVARQVDLVVGQSESADPVVAGAGNLTYTVTVTNQGPSDASGVELSEVLTLRPGVTVDSAVASAGTFAAPTWTLGDLPAGADETLTIVLAIADSAVPGNDVISAQATLTAVAEPLINTGDDAAAVATSIAGEVDLVVSHSESADPVVAGSGSGNLTYVVTVSNQGPSNASGVELSEVLTLPAGASVDSVTPSAGTFAAPSWTLGALPAGASATLTVVLTVGPSAPDGGEVHATAAVVAADQTLIATGDDSAGDSTSIVRQVDLEVSVSESIDPVVAGSGTGNLTYLTTVTNHGPSDASAVELNVATTLPAAVMVDSATASSGTFADPLWNVGALAAGSSASLSQVLTVASSAVAASDAVSVLANLTSVAEAVVNTADDSDSAATSIARTADLEVSVVESIDPVVAGSGGGNLSYVATVVNHGPSDLSGIELEETLTLPSGVALDSVTASSGSFAEPTWTVGNLPAGADADLTVVLTVDASTAPGFDVVRAATALSAVVEPLINTADDAAEEATSVVQPVDLQLTVSESVDPVVAGSGGGNLVYVATLTNHGPAVASDLEISVVATLPAAVAIDSITPASGSFSAPTWSLATLAPGASADLTLVLTVAADAAAGVDVVSLALAVEAVAEPRINPDDDSSAISTSIERQVDLQVSVAESVDPVIAGSATGNLTYVATVTNAGPSRASGVSLSVLSTLPSGVTLVSATPDNGTFSASTWLVGDLAAGANANLTLVLTAAAGAEAGIDSVALEAALIGVDETLIATGDDSASERTSIERRVDLRVTLSESVDPVVAGSGAGNLVLVATVAHLGPSNASGVELDVALDLPTGVVVDSTSPASGSFSGATWSVGDLAAGAATALTVVLSAGADAAAGSDLIGATAVLSAVDETVVATGDDSAAIATSVARQVDLQVAIVESVDPVVAGSGPGNLAYAVTVRNQGPSRATGVELSAVLTLPGGVTLDSSSTGTGTFSAPVWTVGDLPAGATATLDFVLTADAAAVAGSDVIELAAALTAVSEPEIDPGNNSAGQSTSVAAQIDLRVAVAESVDPVIAGSAPANLTHVATVTNDGPSLANGVELSEVLSLPAGVSVDSITPSAGSFSGSTWMLGDLAVGASATLTVVMTVDASASAGSDLVSTTTTVTSAQQALIDLADDSATANTSVGRQVDLRVTIDDQSVAPVIAGGGAGNLVYVTTLSNLGPSDASGVALNVVPTLPVGVTIDSAVPSAGTFVGTTWDVGPLAAGNSTTLTIFATAGPSAPEAADAVTLSAAVSAVLEPLILPGDDAAALSTDLVRRVDLAVAITESIDPVIAGSGPNNLSYVIELTHLGPSDASGVVLTESVTVPAGAVFNQTTTTAGSWSFADSTWTLDELAAGSVETLTLGLTVSDKAAEGTNVISVTSAVTASDQVLIEVGDDSASESTSIVLPGSVIFIDDFESGDLSAWAP